jgi:hypothetical protein
MTALPSPERPVVERRIVRTRMLDVALEDPWSGSARVEFHAPGLAWLKDAEILGARTNLIGWAKPFGEVVSREIVPA